MKHIQEESALQVVGEYLAKRESSDLFRVLSVLGIEGTKRTGRELVEALCLGPLGGSHWKRLRLELQRMQENGLLVAERGRADPREPVYAISERGRLLYELIREARARSWEQVMAA